MELEIKATGKIHHIEVSGDMILWSVEEAVAGHPDIFVGVLYYTKTSNTAVQVPIHRAPDQPFSHPQLIHNFTVINTGGVAVIISGGAEGTIRMWKLDTTTGLFSYMNALEGHTRAVNAVLLHGKHI